MWKAGLSVVAKLNMRVWWNWQTQQTQNLPLNKHKGSIPFIRTMAPYGEPPHFASTLTATKFNTYKGPVCCRFESYCPHQYADIAQRVEQQNV